jgi:hypothetical protein
MMDLLQRQRAESVVKAHVQWFQHLRRAVETGESSMALAVVAADTECEFGKWVHSELPGSCPEHLREEITLLHAEFHQMAAAILALAQDGRQADARSRLGGGSPLADVSRRLVQKVQQLR